MVLKGMVNVMVVLRGMVVDNGHGEWRPGGLACVCAWRPGGLEAWRPGMCVCVCVEAWSIVCVCPCRPGGLEAWRPGGLVCACVCTSVLGGSKKPKMSKLH